MMFFGILSLNSCSKEPEISNIDDFVVVSGISLHEGILEFEDVDAYSQTIETLSRMDENELDRWEKTMVFSSLRSNKVLQGTEELVKKVGKTFSTLLNPNYEIIIAGSYFKLNFESEKITVQKIDTDICDLKSSLMSNEQIFSFDQDVLPSLLGDPTYKSVQSSCVSKSVGWVIMNRLTNGHARYGIRYSRFGIYNLLIAEIERVDGINIEVWIYTTGNCFYKTCGTATGSYKNPFTGYMINGYLQHTIWDGWFSSLCEYNAYVTFGARSSTTDYYTQNESLTCN
jgi:hypothetical protein